jgi:hypothetical protein
MNMMTTTRLDQIAQRQRTSKVRDRMFVLAVALVTTITAITVVLA